MKTLQKLIDSNKFSYVNSEITEANFPVKKIRKGERKVFHFNRYISSENVISEMEKEGYFPANIYELLSWKDWNNKDWVVALGSVYKLYGERRVACLDGDVGRRELHLSYFGGGWGGNDRFLGVRKSGTETSESQPSALGNLVLCPHCSKQITLTKK